jgi:hypothetical protein
VRILLFILVSNPGMSYMRHLIVDCCLEFSKLRYGSDFSIV